MIKFRQAVDVGGGQVRSVGAPTAASDAATKAYADNLLGAYSPSNPLPVSFSTTWSAAKLTNLVNAAQQVKAGAGAFGGYMLYNAGSAVTFVLIYDAASTPTLPATPAYILGIPAGSAANVELTCGVSHTNGIYVAASADTTGNAAPTGGTVTGTIFYR